MARLGRFTFSPKAHIGVGSLPTSEIVAGAEYRFKVLYNQPADPSAVMTMTVVGLQGQGLQQLSIKNEGGAEIGKEFVSSWPYNALTTYPYVASLSITLNETITRELGDDGRLGTTTVTHFNTNKNVTIRAANAVSIPVTARVVYDASSGHWAPNQTHLYDDIGGLTSVNPKGWQISIDVPDKNKDYYVKVSSTSPDRFYPGTGGLPNGTYIYGRTAVAGKVPIASNVGAPGYNSLGMSVTGDPITTGGVYCYVVPRVLPGLYSTIQIDTYNMQCDDVITSSWVRGVQIGRGAPPWLPQYAGVSITQPRISAIPGYVDSNPATYPVFRRTVTYQITVKSKTSPDTGTTFLDVPEAPVQTILNTGTMPPAGDSTLWIIRPPVYTAANDMWTIDVVGMYHDNNTPLPGPESLTFPTIAAVNSTPLELIFLGMLPYHTSRGDKFVHLAPPAVPPASYNSALSSASIVTGSTAINKMSAMLTDLYNKRGLSKYGLTINYWNGTKGMYYNTQAYAMFRNRNINSVTYTPVGLIANTRLDIVVSAYSGRTPQGTTLTIDNARPNLVGYKDSVDTFQDYSGATSTDDVARWRTIGMTIPVTVSTTVSGGGGGGGTGGGGDIIIRVLDPGFDEYIRYD